MDSAWVKLGKRSLVGLTLLGPVTAAAQSSTGDDRAPPPPATVSSPLPPPPPEEDDLPIPTLEIDRIPPSTSYEFAVQVSYGQVAYFRDVEPAWIGFGFRGGWGKNFGNHRLGVGLAGTVEGPISIHTQLGLEPTVNWDLVTSSGILIGVGAGPAAIWTLNNESVNAEYGFVVSPTAVARIGWSQTWSRVGRRLFVFIEPKVRMVDANTFSPLVAIAVGSGQGR